MCAYLESSRLQSVVIDAFSRKMPIAAVCHGVLLAARSIDPATGRSVLHGRRTTSLTWAMERTAWQIARFTRFWDRDDYRTYREEPGQSTGYMSVQSEVTRALAKPEDYCDVDPSQRHAWRKMSGLCRDRLDDERPAFVIRDANYLSARWPGDIHTLATRFAAMLDASQAGASSMPPNKITTFRPSEP